MILLLACSTSSPTATDPGPAPDTADTGPGGDSADSGVDPADVDADGDGFTPNEGDCDDTRPNVYPGAPDYCDGLDADCDGEAIPDGSCSAVGDATAQWSWWIQSGAWEPLGVQVGLISGSGTPDLIPGMRGEEGGAIDIGVEPSRLATRPPVSTWGLPIWTADYPRFTGVIPLPPADATGDGLDDVLVTTDSSNGFQGGVFVLAGRSDGFPTDPLPYDEAAQAYWLDGDGLELDQFSDGSVGDVTGDGLADVLVRTVDRTHDHLTLVPGDPDVNGGHGFSELPSMWTDEDETDVTWLSIVGDLDGDGRSDVTFSPSGVGIDRYILYMSGADWVDGGHLRDVAVALTAGEPTDGDGIYSPAGSAAGDVDHDGVDDALVSQYDSVGGSCATVLSGGVPSGEVAAWTFARVCGGFEASPRRWVGDLDHDGSNDIVTSMGYLIPSAPLAAGGTFDIADFRTPRLDPLQGLRDITDLDGDGLPEWIFTDSYNRGETYILAGFEIPWDDASKW